MLQTHKISKSLYIRGIQCIKSLYLHKNRPFLRDRLKAEQRAKFERGHAIGILAHQLFPGGLNLAPKSPSQYKQAVIKTAEAIAAGTKIIYEASFQHQQSLIILDILQKKDDKIMAFEVKSSIAITETYIQDAAFQYWVMTQSGVIPDDFFLVTVNPEYVHKAPLDPQQYFIITSLLDQILPLQETIQPRIDHFLHVLEAPHSPKVKIGRQCTHPYPCDFQGLCWKKVPIPSIFNLNFFTPEEKFQRYHQGYETPQQLMKCDGLSDDQQWEIDQYMAGGLSISDTLRKRISDTLPLLFVDTLKPAIPLFEGMKPYEEIITLAAIRKNNQGRFHLFSHPEEGKIFLKTLEEKAMQCLTFSTLPCHNTPHLTISALQQAKQLYLPESGNKTSIREMAQLLYGKSNRNEKQMDTLEAGQLWLRLREESLPEEDRKQIKEKLNAYSLWHLNALGRLEEV
ncbi:MAG: hypothetical protein PHU97_00700 [Bacteroidales bacterium]|nr:hypothetical protein [Bacteroidales bacterium]MDD3009821.1 hypothetical protein [Bacteroidales bacterium]